MNKTWNIDMSKKILIDAVFPNETRVVRVDQKGNIEEIEYETANKNQIKGNLYLAKVVRVEPSLQAAFIEYQNNKSGFLPFSEISPDYFHIPVSDREDLTDKSLIDDQIEEGFEQEEEVEYLKDESSRKATSIIYKKYKINEVIKKGQILLVQAQKEERGNKGASFTTYISLAGKYCVLVPNKAYSSGISRRISNNEERKRLKSVVDELTSSSASISLILRTASAHKSFNELKKDYDYLTNLWNKIREVVVSSNAPSFIHQEEGIIQKTLRDMLDKDTQEVMIQGADAYLAACEFIQNIYPSAKNIIKEYRAKTPIFTKYSIEEKLAKLYQPVSYLPSGGYIVINPTEALIAIDVNSGKSTSERNIEETAFKTNLEAVEEIALQSRIRDLAGLIVIDFIDMSDQANRKAIEKALKDIFSHDKAKVQVGSISSFGLLEMSRQRLRASFLESNAMICNHCSGKGLVRADESNAMLILRTIENEIFKGNYVQLNLYAHISSITYIINNKRDELKFIEEKNNIKINLFPENSENHDKFSIEKIKAPVERIEESSVTTEPLLNAQLLLKPINNLDDDKPAADNNKKTKWNKKAKAKKESQKQDISENSIETKPNNQEEENYFADTNSSNLENELVKDVIEPDPNLADVEVKKKKRIYKKNYRNRIKKKQSQVATAPVVETVD